MSVMMPFNGVELMDFANSLTSGYLKLWKANGIVGTLGMIPNIIQDEDRLNAYLLNCLEMEGFLAHDISRIRDWILANIKVDG